MQESILVGGSLSEVRGGAMEVQDEVGEALAEGIEGGAAGDGRCGPTAARAGGE